MKNILLLMTLLVLLTLASCGPLISTPPITQQAPDVINKPTNTTILKDTEAELPKGTWLKTDDDEKVEVVLEEDTMVLLPKEGTPDPKASTLEKQQAVLPKNTHVLLPENTYVQTTTQARVKLEASTQVVLPIGTEIAITKVNWYAILFYCLSAFVVAWYYLQGRNEDKDGDGIIDSTNQKSTTNPS